METRIWGFTFEKVTRIKRIKTKSDNGFTANVSGENFILKTSCI